MMIWDDRLAEVWADPGKAGTGVVIGATAVLTARHLVAGALNQGRILARVVRPGARAAHWVPMTVLAEDADWDVALLGVSDSNAGAGDSGPQWLTPSSPSPVFVQLGDLSRTLLRGGRVPASRGAAYARWKPYHHGPAERACGRQAYSGGSGQDAGQP